jgi:hypothetical protein
MEIVKLTSKYPLYTKSNTPDFSFGLALSSVNFQHSLALIVQLYEIHIKR